MKKKVFIINGSGGVGKDTFVSMVANASEAPVMNFSSVDKIKKIAEIIGWTGAKTEKDRRFLSDLKLLCTEYNDMPFNSMNEKVKEFYDNSAAMLFLHIREPEEIEKAKEAFNARTILIKRDSVKQITTNMADKNVFNYRYDIIIDNNGSLNALRERATNFAKYYSDDEALVRSMA